MTQGPCHELRYLVKILVEPDARVSKAFAELGKGIWQNRCGRERQLSRGQRWVQCCWLYSVVFCGEPDGHVISCAGGGEDAELVVIGRYRDCVEESVPCPTFPELTRRRWSTTSLDVARRHPSVVCDLIVSSTCLSNTNLFKS